MGRQQAGKTSMHSIIFANYPAKDTMAIGYTTDRSENKIKFMGNLTLNLWDCGGQLGFMSSYFTTHKQTIFKNAQVLIYVFDVTIQNDKNEMQDFKSAITLLKSYSQNAQVFVLIHKMDKFKQPQRSQKYQNKKLIVKEILQQLKLSVKQFFATSIWDQTLYKAWSQIVQLMIPNMPFIHSCLQQICDSCGCLEVILFEKSTFLIIKYFNKSGKHDILRYQRLSNIIKQFKLSCDKMGATIEGISVQSDKFSAIIKEFTQNTNIMIVYSYSVVQMGLINLNLQAAGKYFELNMNKTD